MILKLIQRVMLNIIRVNKVGSLKNISDFTAIFPSLI